MVKLILIFAITINKRLFPTNKGGGTNVRILKLILKTVIEFQIAVIINLVTIT